MAQHRALGPSGGAGRVEDHRKLAFLARNIGEIRRRLRGEVDERALPARVQRIDGRVARLRNRGRALSLGRIAHDERGLGIPDKVIKLGDRVGGVERKVDGARTHAREKQQQVFRRLLYLNGDPVAGLNPAPDQRMGKPARACEHLAIADALARSRLDQALARGRNAPADQIEQVSGHG